MGHASQKAIWLREAQPDCGLKPLPLCLDQADQCHRRPRDAGRQVSEIVEVTFRKDIQNAVPTERQEADGFVVRHRRLCLSQSQRRAMGLGVEAWRDSDAQMLAHDPDVRNPREIRRQTQWNRVSP